MRKEDLERKIKKCPFYCEVLPPCSIFTNFTYSCYPPVAVPYCQIAEDSPKDSKICTSSNYTSCPVYVRSKNTKQT